MKLEFTNVISQLNESLDHLLFPGEGTVEERRKCPSCGEGELGLKLGKFGAFIGCAAHPECTYTKQMGGSAEDNGGDATSNEPKALGTDEKTGMEISLRKGPYGHYLQLGEAEGKKKPKRYSLPKGTDIESVDLKLAEQYLTLPREVGTHPETGKIIEASIGRFGPYIKHDGKFVSLKTDDVLEVGINRAVTLIAEAGSKKGAEPVKTLGDHPETGKSVAIYEGRYGPYVKHQRTNASLPKGKTIDEITMEEAVSLLEARSSKGKKPKKSTAKAKKPKSKAKKK